MDKNAPAGRAGFEPGDVIVEVDGKQSGSTQTILKKLFSMKKGDSVSMKVNRKGEIKTLNVTLDEVVK